MSKIVWKMKDKVGMVIDGSENYKEEAMKMMADTGFLNKLLNFPKERINDETCELLQPYFDAPDFNFEDAKKSCPGCRWSVQLVPIHGQVPLGRGSRRPKDACAPRGSG